MLLPFILIGFAAQLVGQKDIGGARRYAWYGLVLAALTQLVALAAIPLIGMTLAHSNYTPAVQGLMTGYIALRLLGIHLFVPGESYIVAEAVETAIKVARKWAYRVKGVPDGTAEIVVAASNASIDPTTAEALTLAPRG